MKDLLHIGLHKTGSTYLQNVIWPQVEGVQYLSRPFTQHNQAFNTLQYADDTLYDPDWMRAILDGYRTERLLISDEALSGKTLFFGSINRSQIARRLHGLFPDATVIVFIRDQRDILLSYYSSYIKEPVGTKSLKDFLWKPGNDYTFKAGVREHEYFKPENLYYNTGDFHLHLDNFIYTPLIDLYHSMFERVEIFLYEDLKHRPAPVLARLSEIVGQQLRAGGVPWNRSFSRNELIIRRTLNKFRPFVGDRLVKGGSRMLGALFPKGNKDSWRREIASMVADYYSEDNSRLKEVCPELPWNLYRGKYI